MVPTKPPVDEKLRLSIKTRKPRVRALNEALVSLGGGRMRSPKDYSRSRTKQETRDILKDEQ